MREEWERRRRESGSDERKEKKGREGKGVFIYGWRPGWGGWLALYKTERERFISYTIMSQRWSPFFEARAVHYAHAREELTVQAGT